MINYDKVYDFFEFFINAFVFMIIIALLIGVFLWVLPDRDTKQTPEKPNQSIYKAIVIDNHQYIHDPNCFCKEN